MFNSSSAISVVHIDDWHKYSRYVHTVSNQTLRTLAVASSTPPMAVRLQDLTQTTQEARLMIEKWRKWKAATIWLQKATPVVARVNSKALLMGK